MTDNEYTYLTTVKKQIESGVDLSALNLDKILLILIEECLYQNRE